MVAAVLISASWAGGFSERLVRAPEVGHFLPGRPVCLTPFRSGSLKRNVPFPRNNTATQGREARLIWPGAEGGGHGARRGHADRKRRAGDVEGGRRGRERHRLHHRLRRERLPRPDRRRGQGLRRDERRLAEGG